MPFKDELRRLRKQDGMTQAELAARLRISKSAVSMYECGNREPDFETLEAIADYFNVDMNQLTGIDKATATAASSTLSADGRHIGILYDRADEKDKLLTHSVLDKYDDASKITAISTKSRNPGGMLEFDVYDEPAAAGLGNYLDAPQSHREQFPSMMVPRGADFCIRISGDSMEPAVANGSTVFVKQAMTVESGKVGVFVLNGSAFCKQLIVDREKQEVRLHSVNPKYEDIIVSPSDDLRTVGQVL